MTASRNNKSQNQPSYMDQNKTSYMTTSRHDIKGEFNVLKKENDSNYWHTRGVWGPNSNVDICERGRFPHTSKEHSNTSWVSHNSVPCWHSWRESIILQDSVLQACSLTWFQMPIRSASYHPCFWLSSYWVEVPNPLLEFNLLEQLTELRSNILLY